MPSAATAGSMGVRSGTGSRRRTRTGAVVPYALEGRHAGGAPTIDLVLLDRSYFELQANFALRVADIEGINFGEACRLHTAFYALAKDNDAGVAPERNDFDAGHPDWIAFLKAIDDGADPVDYVYRAYLDGDAQGDIGTSCFDFTYWPEDRLVRLHFSNDRNGTALRPSTVDDRHRELNGVFQTVARDHPDARAVRGTSWLYHLEAYRRLFPPSFAAGMTSVGHPHQFAALWVPIPANPYTQSGVSVHPVGGRVAADASVPGSPPRSIGFDQVGRHCAPRPGRVGSPRSEPPAGNVTSELAWLRAWSTS